jgi:hypothetical protein
MAAKEVDDPVLGQRALLLERRDDPVRDGVADAVAEDQAGRRRTVLPDRERGLKVGRQYSQIASAASRWGG